MTRVGVAAVKTMRASANCSMSRGVRVSGGGQFDGIICFGGEDWWYHNRGHYDMQMMRELSGRVPVLYINSIGMRVPRVAEGRMFARRIVRKLRSLRRGLVRVRGNFGVFSPLVVPGRWGMAVSRHLMAIQIRRAARQLGIARPLLWVACPPGAGALSALGPVGVVYQRTDRFECFRDVDPNFIKTCDLWLKQRADLTLFCSTVVYRQEAGDCREAMFLDHGVDFDRFAAAGRGAVEEPEDVKELPRPRVGFIGGIDPHTFGRELFVGVARRLPDVQFVLVGACSLPNGWCELPNVAMLGQRAYEEVPAYMAACDVLIMPWTQSEWILACNPVKLKEYLAVGRPVVSTHFDELARYEGFVMKAHDCRSFVRAIRTALAEPCEASALQRRVEGETWMAKAQALLDRLGELGLEAAQ